MGEELLYTSAPQGLKPGIVGFGTVQASMGMPTPLLQGLESLSAYRHPHPPGDSRNPVAWSHLLLRIGGGSWTVVSRVADAGLDFTQRSNKLAHHLTLTASERPAGGPAWLVSQPGFLQTRWNGVVEELTHRRAIPRGEDLPQVCKTWQSVTGDAGWAGVLAESFLVDPTQLACLRFDAGMPVLELLREAVALLPVERRWGVTFTTYATTLPQTATCLWRCLLNGSKEANDARRLVHALQWNLSTLGPLTMSGPLIEAARTGVLAQEHPSVTPNKRLAPVARRESVVSVDDFRQSEHREVATDATDPESPVGRSRETDRTIPPSLPQRPRTLLQRGNLETPRESGGAVSPWLWGGAAAIAVACAAVAIFVSRPILPTPVPETVQGTEVTAASNSGSTLRSIDSVLADNAAILHPNSGRDPTQPGVSLPPVEPASLATTVTTPVMPDKTATTVPPLTADTPAKVAPIEHFEPDYLQDDATVQIPLPNGIRQAMQSSPVSLQLFAPGKLAENEIWSKESFVVSQMQLEVSGKLGVAVKPLSLAAWRIESDVNPPTLTFQWLRPPNDAQNLLRMCALKVSCDGQVLIVHPRPLLERVNLKGGLPWKDFRRDLLNTMEWKLPADEGLSFALHDVVLDVEKPTPPIRFSRTTTAGLEAGVESLKTCRMTVKPSKSGAADLELTTEPSPRDCDQRLKELKGAWTLAKGNDTYAAAFDYFKGEISLDGADFSVLSTKLRDLEHRLGQRQTEKPEESKQKIDALRAIDAIRKDFVTIYEEITQHQQLLRRLEKAKLMGLSLGYHIDVEGLAEPIFVELVRVGDASSTSPVSSAAGGARP